MKRNTASSTAAWVAAARSAGALLPAPLQLADDPFGVRFAGGISGGLARLGLRFPRLGRAVVGTPGPLRAFLLWMQLRTRALDDVLLRFVAEGGRQLVLLGAGYDCRAARFAQALEGIRVLEVDHPATQAVKRRLAPPAHGPTLRYVSWDFALDGCRGLPQRLMAEGLNASERTLTIWEGVTMYLEEPSIEEAVAAVHELGGPGSWLSLTYIDRKVIERPRGDAKLTARLVARVGEPYRFGWPPAALPRWLAQRGFSLTSDDSDADLARRHWPALSGVPFGRGERHVALASRR